MNCAQLFQTCNLQLETYYSSLITHYCILRDTIHEIRDTYLESFVKKNTNIFEKKKDFLNKCCILRAVFYFYLNMLYYIKLF